MPNEYVVCRIDYKGHLRGIAMASEHRAASHERTLEQLFQHPLAHNLEWRDLERLLEAVGTVEVEHNGKVRVEVNGQTTILHRPRHKDVADVEQLVEIRHFLERAGVKPASSSE
jgi:hypothetical protein